jgi:hypothetical protein
LNALGGSCFVILVLTVLVKGKYLLLEEVVLALARFLHLGLL